MYKIAIFFRKTATPNLFRKLVIKALSSDFNNYVACSAFFQEMPNAKKPFSTSKEFIDSLSTRTFVKPVHIDVYGIYGGTWWIKQFKMFCQLLNNYVLNTKNLTCSFYKFKNRSHAKIFIAKENESNSLAIIGSSNLSAGAFANRSSKELWNHESDVIFWDTSSKIANTIVNPLFDQYSDEIKDSTFITNYDDSFFSNDTTLTQKLANLELILQQNSSSFNYKEKNK